MTAVSLFLSRLVWGPGLVGLILGAGLFLSIRTGFAQITLFPQALRRFAAAFRDAGDGAFRSLCTALAATVGTGNLIGVAGAITLGGPGAIFWMWICGFLGMATKFAEATLAVRFRIQSQGEYFGGPMYMIRTALPEKYHILGSIYAVFGVFAAFGVGNATQINAVTTGVRQVLTTFGLPGNDLLLGLLLAVLVGAVLLGGAKRIGGTAEFLVPFASLTYILLVCGVLMLRWQAVPGAFLSIVQGAFQPRAVTGGLVGSWFACLRTGISRGVFTNEAGMGTASIAHACAQPAHPVQQGLLGIIEVFLDTIVICTLTALAILVSGIPIPYGVEGDSLTADAFSLVYGPWVRVILAACICCFAFATVLGWGLYGARCAQYLLGPGIYPVFAWCQIAVVPLGAVVDSQIIWSFSETVNGLMAIPNLIVLVALSRELGCLTNAYKNIIRP